MASESTVAKKWYLMLPWWAWLLAVIISSQISQWLNFNFTGLIPSALSAGFAFFMLYALLALIATIVTIPSRRRKSE